MSSTRQTILASRPAAMVLALTLVAGLTVPFLMLPSAHAGPTPLACAENNHNGCTELSPTPPEDTVAVPANIVLMFDDSGSMDRDFMPDWTYLTNRSNKYAVIDAKNNGVYYNPTVSYTRPPKADGSLYPSQTDMSNVSVDAFGVATTAKINLHEYNASYDSGSVQYSANTNGLAPPVRTSYKYPRGYHDSHWNYDLTSWPSKNYDFNTEAGCDNWYNDFDENRAYQPYFAYNKVYNASNKTCTIYYYEKTTYDPPYFFMYSTGPKSGPYVVYYVAPPTADGGDCSKSPDPSHCVYADAVGTDAADSPAPEGAIVGANIASWFAYYHTRLLMAKSGLMTAFDQLDSKYRFGFASINANGVSRIPADPEPFTFDDLTSGGGNANNKLAVVQPYGNGAANTQKAKFWTWLEKERASGNTPLRKALQGAGEYYKTDQPWTTMQGDPGYTDGSTTKYACRASYTILTTDGFWNGASPGFTNVDATDGPTFTPPAGKTYTVTGYVAADPYKDSYSDTLADVAMYYWENDLQTTIPDELAPSTADPAFWQHMTTFTMGLGFDPTGIKPNGTTIPQIFAWAQGGAAIPGFSWPVPSPLPKGQGSIYNIADLAHAAVNGHGDFFSVKSPEELAAGFAKAIADIGSRNVPPTTAAVNSSVLSVGALSFSTGYNTGDWSGVLDAVTLKADGTADTTLWHAGSNLDADFHSSTSYSNRKAYTVKYDSTQTVPLNSFAFTAANKGSLDLTETAGLGMPAYAGGNDKIENRINYLLGDSTYEGTLYRTRTSVLGAIIRSEPLYVSGATSNYYDSWPTGSPEADGSAQEYDDYVTQQASQKGMVYVGANDGMMHAFHAPVPECSGTFDSDGNCSSYTFASGALQGEEAWAFVPRAVYSNLGNLTNAANFQYRPTVDATAVTRDVFFSQSTAGINKWHTVLVGGVGLGGRGVYALDITDPTVQDFNEYPMTKYPASGVLWEFDSDMTVDSACVSNDGDCKGTDLGYTVSKPNVGRLSDGKWVVLVANGYFPDCTTPDTPTGSDAACSAIAGEVPKDSSGNPYSALFVLDAETGKVLAELKTPSVAGVTSFGLATPVMGDYQNDQIDDVAFAGDVQGNLWRFDLSGTSASDWTVTLVYKGISEGGHQGVQPITSMPRLFPDPTTNRFMVVFGTGKFLGLGDNSNGTVQAVYGVRDVSGTTYTQSDLTQQYLHETTVPMTLPGGDPNPDPLAGASLRCVTGGAADTCDAATQVNAIPGSSGGWFVNLQTTTSGGQVNDAGERVVVDPGAIFASNTVVFETLITGGQGSDPCSPSTQGAIMAMNAITGGPAGVSSLGGWPMVGGRVSNARTSGSLPLVSALGGGQAYLPGATLAPSGTKPLSIDAPVWRRRSWQEIHQNQ